MRIQRDELAWMMRAVVEYANLGPAIVGRTEGGGAVVVWTLGESEAGEPIDLICYLTDDEAIAVMENRDSQIGLLEPIRQSMKHSTGLLSVGESVRGFRLPTNLTEHAFIECVFDAAEDQVSTKDAESPSVERRLLRNVQQARQQLHATA